MKVRIRVVCVYYKSMAISFNWALPILLCGPAYTHHKGSTFPFRRLYKETFNCKQNILEILKIKVSLVSPPNSLFYLMLPGELEVII